MMILQATQLDEFEAAIMIVCVLVSVMIVVTLASIALNKARDYFKKKIEPLYGKEKEKTTEGESQRKGARGKF